MIGSYGELARHTEMNTNQPPGNSSIEPPKDEGYYSYFTSEDFMSEDFMSEEFVDHGNEILATFSPEPSLRNYSASSHHDAEPKARKLRASCDACSRAKVKCDKVRPTCLRCGNMGICCNYSPSMRLMKGRRNRNPDGSHIRSFEQTPYGFESQSSFPKTPLPAHMNEGSRFWAHSMVSPENEPYMGEDYIVDNRNLATSISDLTHPPEYGLPTPVSYTQSPAFSVSNKSSGRSRHSTVSPLVIDDPIPRASVHRSDLKHHLATSESTLDGKFFATTYNANFIKMRRRTGKGWFVCSVCGTSFALQSSCQGCEDSHDRPCTRGGNRPLPDDTAATPNVSQVDAANKADELINRIFKCRICLSATVGRGEDIIRHVRKEHPSRLKEVGFGDLVDGDENLDRVRELLAQIMNSQGPNINVIGSLYFRQLVEVVATPDDSKAGNDASLQQMQARPYEISIVGNESLVEKRDPQSAQVNHGHISPDYHRLLRPSSASQKSYGSASSLPDFDENESDLSSSGENVDSKGIVEVQKETVLDRLMLCVHDMFTQTGHTKHGGGKGRKSSSSHVAGKSKATGPSHPLGNGTPRKRSSEENEDGNEDQSHKRRKTNSDAEPLDQDPERKFACPYYKNDPTNCRLSGACWGPGWDSIHRIKGHIYRVHAMPIHCRRCYVTFDNEFLLTEHSRSAESCSVRSPVPMEGYDKDQERALKGRRTMFQAGSEEEKWKIVYLILFPDTPLGEIPSAYYDLHITKDQLHASNKSPKPRELKQFDAFLRRELPRTIRKRLQVFLENSFGPIEETIKNELEGIVRDAQEALTRGFLGTTLPEHSPTEMTAGSGRTEIGTWQSSVSHAGPSEPRNHVQPQMDALAPYFVPPDAMETVLSDKRQLPANDLSFQEESSDSAYHSLSTQEVQFDEDWFKTFANDNAWTPQFDAEDTAVAGLGNDIGTEQGPEPLYTGKGKGRATDHTFGENLEDVHT